MCGINLVISSTLSQGSRREIIEKMNDELIHRGPDNGSVYNHENISLGHRRLSIIDLSEKANQPMLSDCGNYAIVFNGEIYNYLQLRESINYNFKSLSDSEVVLASFIQKGKACLNELDGMFAFIVVDFKKQQVFIARDRLGIKPLYYSSKGKELIISSEIRPIINSGLVGKKIKEERIAEFFNYKTVYAPDTIWENINMLESGHFKIWSYALDSIKKLEYDSYWSMRNVKELDRDTPISIIKQNINDLFADSVNKRMIGDVPIGTFLSGGVDSTAIATYMKSNNNADLHSFHVNFSERSYSEGWYAQLVADRLGLKHHEIQLSPFYFLDHFEEGINAMDHPSEDGLNVFILSKAVSDYGFKSVLSGLGGDELFGGYYTFDLASKILDYSWLSSVPKLFRKGIFNLRKKVNPGMVSEILYAAFSKDEFDIDTIYKAFRKNFSDTELSKLLNVKDAFIEKMEAIQLNNNYSAWTILELENYTQNVLLRDTDQMSMHHSLEVRVPFLDYKLVEYILSIPNQVKRNYPNKSLFTQSIIDKLPPEIVNRPKMGFNLPIEYWLKKDLRNWADLNMTSLKERSFINSDYLDDLHKKFKKGDTSFPYYKVWPLIIFEKYLQNNNADY